MASPWVAITTSRAFELVMTFFILLAALLVGFESYEGFRSTHGELLATLDVLIVTVFVVEIVLRMLAEGTHPWRFFTHPWNVFDLLLVIASLGPMAAGFVGLLRLTRLMRILRLVRVMPKLRLLIATTLNSIPSIVSITVLMLLLFYVYAVAAVFLFSENDPIHFRNLQTSTVSLFRVITLEDWTDVMYIQIYGCDSYGYGDFEELCTEPTDFGPFGALFFISFVFIGTWIVLNLFIGIILTGMDEARREIDTSEPDGPPGRFDPGGRLLGWVRDAAIGPTSYNGGLTDEPARPMKKPVVPNHLPLMSAEDGDTKEVSVEQGDLDDLEERLRDLTAAVRKLRYEQVDNGAN
ncbi:MAG: ion transporter [Actinomycetota bacterium]|nr:ion transporter [Actinomycetota bacterium]